MDRLESLGNAISQITLYDIKNMYNQAKNVVFNVSEMEAKVREATNDDPWGASSSLMQELATGTFNFQNFNEIMPCIYARFMEKEARQWRQIYKALQLLEYLIKHGSERVVDDARSHISTLKMLRNFHYIDEKGKDEGSNVRVRARELVELLSDVEKIRAERRKAKANKHKYIGTGNDPMPFSGTSRYGGFGSDSYGEGYDRDYGGGGNNSNFRDDNRPGAFQEYNAGADEIPTSARRSGSFSQNAPDTRTSSTEPPKAKEPVKEVDLLDGFGDDDVPIGNSKPASTDKALPSLGNQGAAAEADDDFADFVAAPSKPASTSFAPTPNVNFMDILNPTSSTSRPMAPTQTSANSFSQPARANSANFGLGGILSPTPPPGRDSRNATPSNTYATPSARLPTPASTQTQSKPSGGFDDLWAMSLGGTSTSKKTEMPKMKDLQKERTEAGIWGLPQKPQAQASAPFGSFVKPASSSTPTNKDGTDDLLL